MYYFYFDASALVKRYTQEIGSAKVNFLFNTVPLNRIMCLILGIVELFWVCVRKKMMVESRISIFLRHGLTLTGLSQIERISDVWKQKSGVSHILNPLSPLIRGLQETGHKSYQIYVIETLGQTKNKRYGAHFQAIA